MVFCCALLSGCIGYVFTGASLLYDRHNVYKKMDDVTLVGRVGHVLHHDNYFRRAGCNIDAAVFNQDILLVGNVPSQALRSAAEARVSKVGGYRRLFNQLRVSTHPADTAYDSWITTKIRAQIVADASINPKKFKIVTSDQVVYIMGDVTPEQAKKVIKIARSSQGVKRVVTLLRYYHISDHPNPGR